MLGVDVASRTSPAGLGLVGLSGLAERPAVKAMLWGSPALCATVRAGLA